MAKLCHSILAGWGVRIALTLLAWALFSKPTDAQPPTDLLVLKNGNVMTGVVLVGDRTTTVELTNGSRIMVPTDDIATVCTSYAEAFAFFRDRLESDDIAGHVDLFRWAIRFKQEELAQSQIDHLQWTKVPPSELVLLYRQLESLRAQNAAPSVTPEVKTQMASGNESYSLDSRALGQETPTTPRPDVATVSYQSPANAAMQAPTGLPGPISQNSMQPQTDDTTVPVYELDRALNHVPDFGRASFKKVIEPLLIKNCSNAGCHHQRQSLMPLFEVGRGQAIPKRMSQQNLYQVMRYIGVDSKTSSPLLDFATRAHAVQTTPSISTDSFDYQLLQEWVELMSKPVRDAKVPQRLQAQATATDRDRQIQLSSFESPASPGSTSEVPKKPSGNVSTIPKSLPGTAPRSTSGIPEIPRLNPLKPAIESLDPFDPAEFNRRYHGGRQ